MLNLELPRPVSFPLNAVELFFDLLSHCLVVRIVGVEVLTPRFVEVDRVVRSRQSSEHTVGVEQIPPFVDKDRVVVSTVRSVATATFE